MIGKADRAMLIIGTAAAAVQLCALTVDFVEPVESPGFLQFEEQELPRLAIYWCSGFVAMAIACMAWNKKQLVARCLAVAGTYLMLLGGYGGLFGSESNMPLRIAATAITLVWLLGIAWRASGTHNEPG